MNNLSIPALGSDCASSWSEAPPSLPHEKVTVQWRLSLSALIEDLDELPKVTEERFLRVGGMLEEISGGLLSVAESADAAAELMSGEEASAAIRDMELLIDRLGEDFDAANRSVSLAAELLMGILQELRDMERLMEGFRGHVGNLRMLKLLTNIQGASLSERGAGFRNVATDIGALSGNVHLKSTAILAKIKTVSTQLLKGQTMVAGLGAAHQQLNRKMMDGIRNKIALMSQMNGSSSGAARAVSRRTGEMSRNVAAIVVSMQFQDITRQQIEHAREALAGVRARIVSESTTPSSGALSDDPAAICGLQAAQLARTADDIVAAVNGIVSGLMGMSDEAAASSERLHGLFGGSEDAGTSSLAEIESGISSLMGLFGEKIAVRESLAEVIRATTLAMEEITGFAEEIDYLGSEIRLIALNAMVKASQAGREGSAFGIIAESVKEQSDEICRQASAIGAAIREITTHVAEMRREVLPDGHRYETVHAHELAQTLERLNGLVAEAGKRLLRTDRQTGALAGKINEAADVLRNEEIATLVRHDLVPRLERLTAGLGSRVKNHGAEVREAELRYTMGSEREVHRRFVLGDLPEMTGAKRAMHAEDGELGTNVEFF